MRFESLSAPRWPQGPVKRLADVTTGAARPNGDDVGNVPLVGANGVIGRVDEVNLKAPAAVVGRVGTAGAINVVEPPAWISDNALIATPTPGTDLRFLSHILRVLDLPADAAQTAQPLITQTHVRERVVPIPPAEVQVAIADLLDTETARIDALITKKRRMIALLKARVAALRRTTFEALMFSQGETPLRRLVQCLDGRRVPLNREERTARSGPYAYWGAGGVLDYVDDSLFNETLVLLGEDGAPFFDETRDVAYVVDEKVWVNNHIHVLRPRTEVDATWLCEMLNAVDFSLWLTGSTRDKLTQDEMMQIRVPGADVGTQRQTGAQMEVAKRLVFALVDRLERQIDLLQEHRQALITAAVTGEMEVPGVAA
jgi:type I restriction enzyme S subunit